MRIGTRILATCAIALALGAPTLARAAFITIDDENGAGVIVSAGDFEFGFTVNGDQLSDGIGSSGSDTIAAGTPVNFTGSYLDNGATPPQSAAIFVIAAPGSADAIAELSYTAGTDGEFDNLSGSYITGDLGAVPVGATTLVQGDSFDFFLPFDANALVTTTVPEPISLTLLGTGILGLGVIRRRKSV
jgi:hypothetical protein